MKRSEEKKEENEEIFIMRSRLELALKIT